MPSSGGIYQIKNQMNGKRYIGSAVNLRRRWSQHLSALRYNIHWNPPLQAAFNKYGEAMFAFAALEHIEDCKQLILREQYYLDTLNPEYNIAKTAGSPLGCRRSPETRRKISEVQKGEGHRNYGKHLSEQTRARISQAMMGRPISREHRRKLSEANKGKHHTEDTKQKMREARLGQRRSAETRAKMSKAQSGERNGFYGKHHSKSTRRKMSESHKAYWRRARIAKKEEHNESHPWID